MTAMPTCSSRSSVLSAITPRRRFRSTGRARDHERFTDRASSMPVSRQEQTRQFEVAPSRKPNGVQKMVFSGSTKAASHGANIGYARFFATQTEDGGL